MDEESWNMAGSHTNPCVQVLEDKTHKSYLENLAFVFR